MSNIEDQGRVSPSVWTADVTPSPQVSRPTARTVSSRNGSIELARWFGAIGIVLFHMHLPGQMIGYSALSFFVVLTVYFSHGRPLLQVLERLLLPWAVWSVVYAAALSGKAVLLGQPWTQPYQLWMWGTGPALHLWYLLFCAGFLVLLRGLGNAVWAYALLPVTLATLYITNMLPEPLPLPFRQWIVVLPGACLGAMMVQDEGRADSWIAAMAVGAGAAWAYGWDTISPQLTIMAVVLLAVRRCPLPATKLVRELGSLSLGIYLLHPLLLAIMILAAQKTGLVVSDWSIFAGVIVLSHVFTMILKRIVPRLV